MLPEDDYIVCYTEHLAETLEDKFQLTLRRREQYHFKTSAVLNDCNVCSALSFAAGLFRGEGPLEGYQPIQVEVSPVEQDSLLRFDEHDCPLYDSHVTNNKVC